MKSGLPCGNLNAASREAILETKRLSPDATGIERAAMLLSEGQLVAFPTETVYGLGADARDDRAVAAIYQAKGRPSFNPLIVHVTGLEMAKRFGVFSDAALKFVGDGWPAGLTVVVPLREGSGLSELVTAGQPSVALRQPKAKLALELLERFGGPVAAPSANPSGRISPTTADHVLSGLSGKISAVLDGGATASGLESTIIGFSDNGPVVLREGVFQVPDGMVRATIAEGNDVQAPGQLSSHYAPLASVRLGVTRAHEGEVLLGFGEIAGDLSLSKSGDLVEAAANLFSCLHDIDARGVARLAVAPIPDQGIGRAINDRLRRAAAPR